MTPVWLTAAILGLPGLFLLFAGGLLEDKAYTAGREVGRYRNLFHSHWGTSHCVTYYRRFCRALERYYSLEPWASVFLNAGWVLVLLAVVTLVVGGLLA